MLDPWLDQPASQHVRSWLGLQGARSFPELDGFAAPALTDSRVSCESVGSQLRPAAKWVWIANGGSQDRARGVAATEDRARGGQYVRGRTAPTFILRGTGTPPHQLTVVEQPTKIKDPKSEREKNFETHYRSVLG